MKQKNFGTKEELEEFARKPSVDATLQQLKNLKDNVAFREFLKVVEWRLETMKDTMVEIRKIDKIRIAQGRCSEDEHILELVDMLIEEKKIELNNQEESNNG